MTDREEFEALTDIVLGREIGDRRYTVRFGECFIQVIVYCDGQHDFLCAVFVSTDKACVVTVADIKIATAERGFGQWTYPFQHAGIVVGRTIDVRVDWFNQSHSTQSDVLTIDLRRHEQ